MIFVIRAIYNADEETGGNEVIHWAGSSDLNNEDDVKNEVKRLNKTKDADVSYYDLLCLPTISLGHSFSEDDLDGNILN